MTRPVLINGGEGGIRTHGRLPYDGFQDRSVRPLRHLSAPEFTASPPPLHPTSGHSPSALFPNHRHSERGVEFLLRRRSRRPQHTSVGEALNAPIQPGGRPSQARSMPSLAARPERPTFVVAAHPAGCASGAPDACRTVGPGPAGAPAGRSCGRWPQGQLQRPTRPRSPLHPLLGHLGSLP